MHAIDRFAAGGADTAVYFKNLRVKELRPEAAKLRIFEPARDTPIDQDAIGKTDHGWKNGERRTAEVPVLCPDGKYNHDLCMT
jgi:hypothetical protein